MLILNIPIQTGLSEVNLVTVTTPTCFVCGNNGTVDVPESEYLLWTVTHGPIQECLTSVSVDDREMLISGTHPSCWTLLYGDDNESD